MLTFVLPLGVYPPRLRDDSLHEFDRAYALQMEAQSLHLPLGKSDSSKDAILAEGTMNSMKLTSNMLRRPISDRLRLHPDPFHRQC